MMEKLICYALVYVAEGLIAWFYLDYVFLRKRMLWKHILQFVVSYALLFGISQLDNAPLNALCFTAVHWLLIFRNYHCGKKTAIIHSGLLCVFVMVAEVMGRVLLSYMVCPCPFASSLFYWAANYIVCRAYCVFKLKLLQKQRNALRNKCWFLSKDICEKRKIR